MLNLPLVSGFCGSPRSARRPRVRGAAGESRGALPSGRYEARANLSQRASRQAPLLFRSPLRLLGLAVALICSTFGCSPATSTPDGATLPAPNTLVVAADDLLVLYLNGSLIATGDDAHLAVVANASLLPGRNVLAARVINKGGPGGLLVDLPTPGGHVVTTTAWKLARSAPDDFADPSFDDRAWDFATSYGRLSELGWKHPLEGFPTDSSAEWIAGTELKSTEPLYFRYAFTSNGRGDLADARATGFASLPGRGLATTTGGGRPPAATVVTATSVATFTSLVGDDVPRIVHVPEGVLDFHGAARAVTGCLVACGARDPGRSVLHLPTSTKTCADIDPAAAMGTGSRDEGRVNVGSNKTIIGDGTGAILSGLALGLYGSSNVILRNLVFENVNPGLLEASDAITIQNAHHVWIDHCTFRQFSDDAIDVIPGASGTVDDTSTFITLSWNRFDGNNAANCGGLHPGLSSLQGAAITLHHNWFDGSLSVAPSLRGDLTRLHAFNNALSNISGLAVDLRGGGQALLEANWFTNVGTPFAKDSVSLLAAPAAGDGLRANVFTGSTTPVAASTDVLTGDLPPAYPYTLDTPESTMGVPAAAGAGPQVR